MVDTWDVEETKKTDSLAARIAKRNADKAKDAKADRDARRARNLASAIAATKREVAKKAAARKADKAAAAKAAKDNKAAAAAAAAASSDGKGKGKGKGKGDGNGGGKGKGGGNGSGDTAKKRSPASYRPDVPIAGAGDDVFYGTNIPTKGYSREDIDNFNSRLKVEINSGNTRDANDVIFDIAYSKGGGQGNERVGAVQSGMYKLDNGPLWGEHFINSTNDRYVVRDASGKPTGEEIRYDDASGVVKGNEGSWTSVGSWGGNAKAGIVEGQPTAKPPPSGLRSIGIRDLDEGRMMATGQAGGGGYTGGGYTGGGYTGGTGGGYGGGGLLGGGFGEYQIPNRNFTWQTDPTEQALMASAMGRPDLAQMMLTGQYGPLAGQQYQYGGGRTRINYGPGGGYGGGYGGGAGAGGGLGPLGGAGAVPAAGTRPANPDLDRQDWWPPGATNARMAAWMRDNPGKTALDWTNQLPKLGESLAGLRGLFGGGDNQRVAQTPAEAAQANRLLQTFNPDPYGFEDRRALAAQTPSTAAAVNPFLVSQREMAAQAPQVVGAGAATGIGGTGYQQGRMWSDEPGMTYAPGAEARMGSGLDFSGMPSHSDLAMRASRLNPYDVSGMPSANELAVRQATAQFDFPQGPFTAPVPWATTPR